MKKILYVTNTTRSINRFFIPHINMLLESGYQVDCATNITGGDEIKKGDFIKKIKFFDIPSPRTPIHYNSIISFIKL